MATNAAKSPEASLAARPASTNLACYACKRRKIKCDRRHPVCIYCQRLDLVCEYPTRSEKPGPKTGSSQRAKRRKFQHPESPSNDRNSTRDLFLLSTAAAQLSPSSPARHNPESGLPQPRGSGLSQNALLAQDGARSHEAALDSPQATDGPASDDQPASAPIFSRIMYPSHESQTRPQSPSTADASPENQNGVITEITARSVCAALQLSKATYDLLMGYYFTNMTAFSLFRPGSIEPKFAMMQRHSDAEALVASIFSFSARYCRDGENCPSPSHFARVASLKLDESIENYGDVPPPLWLLQASILVSFYQLTLSVRSRSWKKLGDCIRYAYDMHLHLVDANHDPAATSAQSVVDIPHWALLEERRRAWWAVWEMDVFASTIRRLPTAIDASLNLTMLPVPDGCWFRERYQESCFLAEDPSLRWKHLAQSGNRSAKAWFIVVNSLMRNTQRIVYPAGPVIQSLDCPSQPDYRDELNIMANTLYCTITSLPTDLVYQGETLDFRIKHVSSSDGDIDVSSRQRHADKYSIHLMTQLCRFMVYHHRICARAPWLAQRQKGRSDKDGPVGPLSSSTSAQQANSEWSNYINASEEIVTVVRNSARDHCRYVNPFLTNTLWFAAAAQVACNVFGPASLNKRLASSNLDLLKLTIEGFVSFWGGMESLRGKLARIETGLQNLMTRPNHPGSGDGPATAQRQQGPAARRLTTRISGGTVATGGERNVAGGLPDNLVQLPTDDREVNVVHHAAGEVGTIPAAVMPESINANSATWVDPRWPGLGSEYLYGFTPQFTPMPGQTFYPITTDDSLDFSPFGLEELLVGGSIFGP